jgi:hypothetical protein
VYRSTTEQEFIHEAFSFSRDRKENLMTLEANFASCTSKMKGLREIIWK